MVSNRFKYNLSWMCIPVLMRRLVIRLLDGLCRSKVGRAAMKFATLRSTLLAAAFPVFSWATFK